MKKRSLMAIKIGLLVAGIILVSACNNIFSPSNPMAPGNGNVIVSFSAGRAALSPTDTVFDEYEFIFKRDGDAVGLPYVLSKNDPFVFTLPIGDNYTLDVNCYKGSCAEENLAAFGTSAEPFIVGNEAANVLISLNGNQTDGTGTFSYVIKVPAGVQIDEISLLGNSVVLNADPVNEILSGSAEINAGWHFVILRMNKIVDGQKLEAGYANGVLIYKNNITYLGTTDDPFELEEDCFIGNRGEKVLYWHGFRIDGDGYHESHDIGAGYGIGTQYQLYKDETGIYSDVLKLEPPDANGFEPGAMALVYQLPFTGTYQLSMDIKVIKQNPGDDVYLDWSNSDSWDCIAGDRDTPVIADQWLSISTGPGGVYLYEDDAIGLLANLVNMDGHPGIKDATIYIKNLNLKVETEEGDIYVIVGEESGSVTFRIVPNNFNLYSKGTRQLVVFGEDLSNVTWSSGNNAIATVSTTGLVNAAKVTQTETVTITATADDKTATATVTVKPWDKFIALTFDDGPDPGVTVDILDTLLAKNVHATFFSVGARVAEYPAISLRASNEGHDIANHSKHHRQADYHYQSGNPGNETLYKLYKDELVYTQNIIEEKIGKAPVFFRSPGLCENPSLLQVAAELGLPDIFCQDTNDYMEGGGMTPEIILGNAKNVAKPWGILLFHDYYGGLPMEDVWIGNGINTKDAIPLIINWLWENGYEVLSVSEMLAKRNALYLTPGVIYEEFTNVPADPAFPADGIIVPVSGITASETSVTIEENTSQTITVDVLPGNASHNKVYWYSENTGIATVYNGTITGVSEGITTIVARAEHKTVRIEVTVTGGIPDPNVGELLGNDAVWHGFLVRGPSGSEGDPVATLYENYTDTNGDEWNDVLKLAPPAGGYADGKLALSRTLQPGKYKLSADIWVVKKNIYDDVYLCWESLDDPWYQVAGSYETPAIIEPGEWYHLTGDPDGIEIGYTIEIAFLLKNLLSDIGINNATIYIKDLELIIVEPPDDPPPEPVTTWDVFNYAGYSDIDYLNASGAIGEEVVFKDSFGDTYTNVLKLYLPNNGTTVPESSAAMTYAPERTGFYKLSVWAWVEKGSDNNVTVTWEMNGGTYMFASYWDTENGWNGVDGSQWLYISSPDYIWLDADTYWVYLLALNSYEKGNGLKDSTIYFRDLKLEMQGAENLIIDIASVKTERDDLEIVINLEWDKTGLSLLPQEPITVTRGNSVTLNAPSGVSKCQWYVDGWLVPGATGPGFTFDSNDFEDDGSYTVSLWAGSSGGDAVVITVVGE